MKFLITTGGTRVPIDDVRHIGNSSTGQYGFFLHQTALRRDHDSVLFRDSHNHYEYPEDIDRRLVKDVVYKDYWDYLKVKDLIVEEKPDIIISTAAVSDYVVDKQQGKLSSYSNEMTITLKKSEKVISSFRELAPNAIIVGFKLLVSPTESRKKDDIDRLFDSGVDYVTYNDLTELRKGNSKREYYKKNSNGKFDPPYGLIKYLEDQYDQPSKYYVPTL